MLNPVLEELDATLGLRSVNPYDNIAYDPAYINLDREFSFVDSDLVAKSLTLHIDSDGRKDIYLAGERVRLVIMGNRVDVRVGNQTIRYGTALDWIAKAVYKWGDVVKEIDGDRYYGFVVKWNKVHLMLWYNKEKNHVGIKRWSDKILTNSYYRKLGEFRIRNVNREPMETELEHPIYGDAISGLGSVAVDSIVEELDAIYERLQEIKENGGDKLIEERIEDIVEMLTGERRR